jgi:hypothetical protein
MWIKILTFLKTIINSKIFLYAVIGLVIYLWFTDRKNLTTTITKLDRNQTALLSNHNEQVELTRREFQKFYRREDSIMQLIGIKPKQVQNVIVNNYHYKDSTIVIVPLKKDSVTSKSDTLKFLAPLGCMKVSGYVINKTLVFEKESYSDKFHTFLYGERPYFFLGIKWLGYGKWIINSKTYSECLNDVVETESNLKIDN